MGCLWGGATPRRLYYSGAPAKIQLTICCSSSSETPGLGGMGMGPHTPELPPLMCCANVSAAAASPVYFSATSRYDGPTSLLSTAWQAKQAFLAKMGWMSARPGASSAAAAGAAAALSAAASA